MNSPKEIEIEYVHPNNLPAHCRCPICLNVLDQNSRTETNCGIIVCGKCSCKCANPQFSPQILTIIEEALNKLPVYCSNRSFGCNWTGCRGELVNHMKSLFCPTTPADLLTRQRSATPSSFRPATNLLFPPHVTTVKFEEFQNKVHSNLQNFQTKIENRIYQMEQSIKENFQQLKTCVKQAIENQERKKIAVNDKVNENNDDNNNQDDQIHANVEVYNNNNTAPVTPIEMISAAVEMEIASNHTDTDENVIVPVIPNQDTLTEEEPYIPHVEEVVEWITNNRVRVLDVSYLKSVSDVILSEKNWIVVAKPNEKITKHDTMIGQALERTDLALEFIPSRFGYRIVERKPIVTELLVREWFNRYHTTYVKNCHVRIIAKHIQNDTRHYFEACAQGTENSPLFLRILKEFNYTISAEGICRSQLYLNRQAKRSSSDLASSTTMINSSNNNNPAKKPKIEASPKLASTSSSSSSSWLATTQNLKLDSLQNIIVNEQVIAIRNRVNEIQHDILHCGRPTLFKLWGTNESNFSRCMGYYAYINPPNFIQFFNFVSRLDEIEKDLKLKFPETHEASSPESTSAVDNHNNHEKPDPEEATVEQVKQFLKSHNLPIQRVVEFEKLLLEELNVYLRSNSKQTVSRTVLFEALKDSNYKLGRKRLREELWIVPRNQKIEHPVCLD